MNTAELNKLKQKAMDLLARREHSRYELSQKLRDRDFAPDDIQAVLDQLEQSNLLSDARFAESYIMMRSQRGYGQLRIKQELVERGVSENIIEAMLHEGAWEWASLLTRVHQKKFKHPPDDVEERNKQSQFLYYRGFTPDQIKHFFKSIN
jgi:regulatory protein